MNNILLKKVKRRELKKAYAQIESLYHSRKTIPQQVFKNPKNLYVFSYENFMGIDDYLKNLIQLSVTEKASQLTWLPRVETKPDIRIVQFNLTEKIQDLKGLFQKWWDEGILFSLLEYGCLFNDQKNWVIQISIELELIVMGTFCEMPNLLSELPFSPYTKESFLEEFQEFPEDYVEGFQESCDDQMGWGRREAEIINTKIVFPMVENYF